MLVILAGGGTETVTINTLDTAFNAGLEVYGTAHIELNPKTDPLSHLSVTETFAATKRLFGSTNVTVTIAGSVTLGGGQFTAVLGHLSVADKASLTPTGPIPVGAASIQP